MLITMGVDRELIGHVADVARLKLTESEIDEFLPQLKEIIKAFEEIQQIDTNGVKPSFHSVPIKNSLREDIPKMSLSVEKTLKNVRNKKDGYIIGPKVV
jgi:aspartyl-tRNA(Asn)/glutamyl-tRNA(Gln) amidotransferase subunit C